MKARVLIIIVLAVILFGPIVAQILATPDDAVWTGFYAGGIDYYTYLGKIQHGVAGNWTYTNLQTPEATEAAPIYTMFLAMGHVARVLKISPIVMFHAVRVFIGVLTLCLISYVLRDENFLAPYLAVMASGIGVGLLGPELWTWRGEFFVQGHLYIGMMGFPHYMVTLSGMLLCLEAYRTGKQNWRKTTVLGVVGANCIALNHPFLLLLIALIILCHSAIYNRSQWLTAGIVVTIITVAALPLVWILGRAFLTIEWLQLWRDQAVTITVPIVVMVLAYGITAILALVEAPRCTGWKGIWVVWVVVAFALAYSSILQNAMEFTFFVCVPFGALAAEPLMRLLKKCVWWLRPAIAMLVCAQAFLLVILIWDTPVSRPDAGFLYLPNEYVAGLQLLKTAAEDGDVVLGPLETGNMVPYWIPGKRPFLGHTSETLHFARRAGEAAALYRHELEDAAAKEWLLLNSIKWVIVDKLTPGNFESVIPGGVSWGNEPLEYSVLEVIHHSEYLIIYKVRGEIATGSEL